MTKGWAILSLDKSGFLAREASEFSVAVSILRPSTFGELSITRSCCSPRDGIFLEHKPWAVLASGPGRYKDTE